MLIRITLPLHDSAVTVALRLAASLRAQLVQFSTSVSPIDLLPSDRQSQEPETGTESTPSAVALVPV